MTDTEKLAISIQVEAQKNGCTCCCNLPCRKLTKRIKEALDQAILEERNSIAESIMTIDNTYLGPQHREKLASAIRNRTRNQEGV